MRATISERDFNKLKIEISDYDREQIQDAKQMAELFAKFIPGVEVRYDVYTDNETLESRFQRAYVYFLRNKILFQISKETYPKRIYKIYADISDLHKVDYSNQCAARRGSVEPNKIGTPTQKKVDDWIAYEMYYYTNLEKINERNKKEEEDFRALLARQPDVRWVGQHKGHITRNGLEFHFTIETNYISTSVKMVTTSHGFDDFLLLCDNKYKQPEE